MNIDKLDIIKGGIAKKELSPILKHLRIQSGWVTATNGRLTISTVLGGYEELDVTVPADTFIKAVKACKEPKFHITEGGRLSIRDSKFRALMPLLKDAAFPSPDIRGESVDSLNIMDSIMRIHPFVGEDASRPWVNGILLYNNMAYATNNTVLVKTPVDWMGPAVNLPDFLLEELIRLKRDILSIKTDGINITFELEDNVWLNSVLLPPKWPNVENLFNKLDYSNIKEIPSGLLQAINDIIPFCPDKKFPRIRFTGTAVATDEGNHQAEVEFDGLNPSVWRAEPLLLILDRIKTMKTYADFSFWPNPCPWQREDAIQGIIIGLRDK